MTKRFCDCCGTELNFQKSYNMFAKVKPPLNGGQFYYLSLDLCEECVNTKLTFLKKPNVYESTTSNAIGGITSNDP